MATLFEKFGGTRAMADALGEAPSTVQSWKSAARVPAHKQPGVLARAEALGLPVAVEDVVWPLGRSPLNEETDNGGRSHTSSGNLSSDSQQEAA